MENTKKIWIFGYGSLVWKPGFEFCDSKLGFITGFDRRFWQGNTAQRGTPAIPGRVATLVDNSEGKTWGRAFELTEDNTVTSLTYLDNREKTLGGYTSFVATFQCKDSNDVFPVIVYVATSLNDQFLGPAPLCEIADEIVHARGTCGTNVEYVLRLTEYFRECLPEGVDEHLLNLEKHIRTRLDVDDEEDVQTVLDILEFGLDNFRNICPGKVMKPNGTQRAAQSDAFSSRIPSRSLKCVSV